MTSGPMVPSCIGNDQLLPPTVSWPDFRLLPDLSSMVLVLQPAVGRSPADYATVNVPHDLVLSHTGLHRKMQALQIGSAPARRHASKVLRAFTYWRCAAGGWRPRALHFLLG